MSIRSDIRASLVAHSDGRTSEDLLDKYIDYDPAVIALELARLRRDGFIRSIGMREARPIYVIANWPEGADEVDEDLTAAPPRLPPNPLRGTAWSDAPARRLPQPQRQPIREESMETSEKILKAIEAGPKRRRELASMIKGKDNLDHILEELLDAKKIMRQGHGRGTEYAKRANGAPPASPPAAPNGGKVIAGYHIESGMQIPLGRGHMSPLVQALLAIDINQSIVHDGDPKSAVNSKSVRAAERKFTVRAIGDGKHRVWRIS